MRIIRMREPAHKKCGGEHEVVLDEEGVGRGRGENYTKKSHARTQIHKERTANESESADK